MTVTVWEATLDNIYYCEVARKDDHTGVLTIKKDNVIIHSCDVSVSYGAIFGPDIYDVYEWERICAEYVDKINGDSNEQLP